MKIWHWCKKNIFIVLAVLIGGIVFWGMRGQAHEYQRASLMDEVKPELREDTFDVVIASTCEQNNVQMKSYVRWWSNEQTGEYYFFLPNSWRKDDRAFWVFTNVEEITLDNRVIRSGDVCNVDAGLYTMKVYDMEYSVRFMYSGEIASLFLTTESGGIEYLHEDKENKERAEYVLFDNKGNLNNHGQVAEISGRGNSTFETEIGKKPYHIELQEKSQILGMGEEKDWWLVANVFDPTLSRNMIVHTVADELGLAYTPDMEYIDLYINGEYRGNYLLSEKLEVGKDRVNIQDLKKATEVVNPGVDLSACEQVIEDPDKLYSRKWFKIPVEPDDYTGGYLLEIDWIDRYGVEQSGFITSRMEAVVLHSPKYATHNQIGYIADLYQDFEDAVYSETGFNEKTEKYFYEYIDIESFAIKYMIEELVKNLDASYTSCYFYKPEFDDKIYAGPVWDYDVAIPLNRISDEWVDLHEPVGFYVAMQKKDYDIWHALYQQPYFREYVDYLRENMFIDEVSKTVDGFIDENAERIVDSAMMDAVLWNKLGEGGPEEKEKEFYKLNTELKAYLDARLEYLNEEWNFDE